MGLAGERTSDYCVAVEVDGVNIQGERSQGVDRAIAQRFEEGEDLVDRILRQLKKLGVSAEVDDLRGFGHEGLWEAAHRFDPERGSDFRRFAYFRVKGAMLDGARKMGSWSRRGYERVIMMQKLNSFREDQLDESEDVAALSAAEAAERLRNHMASVATALTVGVYAHHIREKNGEILAVDRNISVEEQMGNAQMVRLVRQAVSDLPPPEDEVIRRHYIEGEQMDSIALVLSCSKSWVSRIHGRAIRRMGVRLRASIE